MYNVLCMGVSMRVDSAYRHSRPTLLTLDLCTLQTGLPPGGARRLPAHAHPRRCQGRAHPSAFGSMNYIPHIRDYCVLASWLCPVHDAWSSALDTSRASDIQERMDMPTTSLTITNSHTHRADSSSNTTIFNHSNTRWSASSWSGAATWTAWTTRSAPRLYTRRLPGTWR